MHTGRTTVITETVLDSKTMHVHDIVAERLSARQLIVQRSHITSVYIYMYIYICIIIHILYNYPSHFNCEGQGAVASLRFLWSR